MTYQDGATVHLPSGRTVTLPAKGSGQVLGKRHGAWIVVVGSGEPDVVAVKGSRVRTIWHHVYDESATSYSLVDGADQVVEWNYTRGGTTEATVFDLDGAVLDERSWGTWRDLLDADADGLLVAGRGQTFRWRPGTKPVPVAPAAWFADLGHDLLMVPAADDTVGPTALSAPGAPGWTAEFDPEAVSPDGTWIAGVTWNRRPRLAVRRLSDGTPAAVPPIQVDRDPVMVGDSHVQLRWEPDGDLLVVVRGDRGRAVVRCTTAGSCERATGWVKGRTLAFPS